MTGDRDTAGQDAAADQDTGAGRNDPAAVNDGAVDGAAAEDGDAGRRAGDEIAVEEAAVRNVLLMTVTPPVPIVPALVTPPLKLVALITMAVVWPLNLVGYGPVNATERPDALLGRHPPSRSPFNRMRRRSHRERSRRRHPRNVSLYATTVSIR